MDQRVCKILIVGGGTSGWMTAAYLNRVLSVRGQNPVEITLIESRDIGIIGVGEATLANIKRMMLAIEINEMEFMRACDASFKNAIRFEGFHKKGVPFWHPFTQLTHVNRFSLANLWLGLKEQGMPVNYAEAVTPDPAMCDNYRAPKSESDPFYQGLVNYAYHIDTVKLGRYLRELAKSRGVDHVIDTVTEVHRDEQGNVSYVDTKESGALHADLFIDCTGFLGLLINKTLDVPFIGYNDVLFNNAAVALRVPYADGDRKVKPYTGCYAQGAGWIWEIPLYKRRGIGHVYCDQFISKDEAEKQLRDWIGPEARDCEANHIRMRIGRTERAWDKNVVSIGLSGGFIEPLESTGIYLVELGLSLLHDYFPTKDNMAVMARQYSDHMRNLYEQIRDFICMHYCLTDREDTDYWRECKNHPAVPDSLREKLTLWRERLPTENDLGYSTEIPAFSAVSYTYIALGMGLHPRNWRSGEAFFDDDFARAVIQDRQRVIGEAMAQAPDHWQLIHAIHGAKGKAWAKAGQPG